METLPRFECNGNGNRLGTKNLQKRSKTAELPFAHIKQNRKFHEFTTIGIKNINTEFKIYTIGHNLKRIYGEINKKNN